MSTKIYNGMVVPLNRLEDFIKLFHDKAIKKAQDHVKLTMNGMSAKRCKKSLKDIYGEDCPEDISAHVMLMSWIINASRKSEAVLNIDIWFNAWIIKDKVYLYAPADKFIPTAKDFPSWCKDFSYWDNTDPDEKVSSTEWKKRSTIWNNIMDKWYTQNMKITHVVIEAKDVFDKGILQIFPDVDHEKIFSIHHRAYYLKKKKED